MHVKFTILSLTAGLLLLCGCSQQDSEKTRQQAKQSTEQIKEGSKVAAVELKKEKVVVK